MQDGRMTSLVTVQLFGPDGALKTGGCGDACINCPEQICGEAPEKEESND